MTTPNLSNLTSLIYKSRKNILDLMDQQGYNTSDYTNFTITEVNSMKQNNQLDMLLEKTNEDPVSKIKSKIYIRYYLTKMIRPANIHEMIDDLYNLEEVLTKNDTLFIIIKDDMNETIISELKQIWEKDISNIELHHHLLNLKNLIVFIILLKK
jgi:hypothetical protein